MPSCSLSDRDLITTFLQVKEPNRRLVATPSNIAKAKLTKYTPVPEKGFPTIHLASPGQLLEDIDGVALQTWITVSHPKLLARVFDYDGSDPTKMNPIITRRIKDTVNEISSAYNAKNVLCEVSPPTPVFGYPVDSSPNTFLIHNISDEIRDILVNHKVWSSANLTFEVRSFVERTLPTLLFNLAGFTTNQTDIVQKVIQTVWTDKETRYTILTILKENDPFFRQEDVLAHAHAYLDAFIDSVTVKFLDYKVAGGIETPRFNIFATSPTTSAHAWTVLRQFLTSLGYPTALYGSGSAANLFLCTLCHSVSHPRGLCEFTNVPL